MLTMKHLLLITGLVIFACSCKKEQNRLDLPEINGTYLAVLKNALGDSLQPAMYRSLDFNRVSIARVDSLGKCYTRIALAGRPLETDFFIARTDLYGKLLSGRLVHIYRDSADLTSFSGLIQYTTLRGHSSPGVLFVRGRPGAQTAFKATDPEMDGGELPPVVVTYTPAAQGISYADWYNLEDMAGDNANGYTGYYSPAEGGGVGQNAAAQVDFEFPENKEAIDLQKYLNCFGSSQEAAATYTITIAVDLPVDNDPSRIFNWSDQSPGHTFIELYKNGAGGLVQQDIGFYPDYSWKTVGGGDVDSKMSDDAGHEYQAKYTISVTAGQFTTALHAAQTYSTSDYNVASFNCADYALKVFNAAGGHLTVPSFPVPGYSDASNTPQGVYKAIAQLVLAGNKNALANAQKQWAGSSHGACD